MCPIIVILFRAKNILQRPNKHLVVLDKDGCKESSRKKKDLEQEKSIESGSEIALTDLITSKVLICNDILATSLNIGENLLESEEKNQAKNEVRNKQGFGFRFDKELSRGNLGQNRTKTWHLVLNKNLLTWNIIIENRIIVTKRAKKDKNKFDKETAVLIGIIKNGTRDKVYEINKAKEIQAKKDEHKAFKDYIKSDIEPNTANNLEYAYRV
ncbi:12445_t:CDS:2 [Gigaspora margarita]|uniref:12445_t:CDS:1 n=1 Tax=Gigaspora margarita TaxID=4874 RepID=A0ABN7V272_GIGMA|nr:12445_t:CDS:2 [Gigaspora margarita]